jgi:hypothetical protein
VQDLINHVSTSRLFQEWLLATMFAHPILPRDVTLGQRRLSMGAVTCPMEFALGILAALTGASGASPVRG